MAKDKIVKPFLYISKDQYRIDNIEDMKGVDLIIGDVIELQGYYTAGDGAHHKRKIEATDDGSGVRLVNGLYANIVHDGEVNVSWFGAKGDGVADDTEAIRKACFNYSNVPITNSNSPKFKVLMGGGNFVISDTICIRKGMSLEGAGGGSTRIVAKDYTKNFFCFKMGYRIENDAFVQDETGLPPTISKLHCDGVHSFVECGVAGAFISSLFITNFQVGIQLSGTDCIVTNIIGDQGSVLIDIPSSQNNIITNVISYLAGYTFYFSGDCIDTTIANCNIEYTKHSAVQLTDSARLSKVFVKNSNFVYNVDYNSLPTIDCRSNNSEIYFDSCTFSNFKTCFRDSSGLSSFYYFNNCVFDGEKTNDAYDQNVNQQAFFLKNNNIKIKDCFFNNLKTVATIEGTYAANMFMDGCEFKNIVDIDIFTVKSTSSSSNLYFTNNKLDGNNNIVSQVGCRLHIKNNINMFEKPFTDPVDGKYCVKLLKNIWLDYVVKVSANTNANGNPEYRAKSNYNLFNIKNYINTNSFELHEIAKAGYDGYVQNINLEAISLDENYILLKVKNDNTNSVVFEIDCI